MKGGPLGRNPWRLNVGSNDWELTGFLRGPPDFLQLRFAQQVCMLCVCSFCWYNFNLEQKSYLLNVSKCLWKNFGKEIPILSGHQTIYHSAAAFHSPLCWAVFFFEHVTSSTMVFASTTCATRIATKNRNWFDASEVGIHGSWSRRNLAKQQTSSQQMLYGLRGSIFLWNFGSKHTIWGKRLIFSLMHFQFGCLSIPKPYSTFQKVFLDLKIFWESIWWHQVSLVVR